MDGQLREMFRAPKLAAQTAANQVPLQALSKTRLRPPLGPQQRLSPGVVLQCEIL